MNADKSADGGAAYRRHRETADDEHDAFLRSMTQVDWLALLVVALYLMVDATPLSRPAVALLAMLAFGGFALALRWRRFPLRETRARIAVDVVVTIVFILVMAAESGGPASPMVNLFLLPIVLAAVTLGPRGTLVVFVSVALAFVVLFALDGQLHDPTPALFARLFGELGPFALVAYLTQRLAGSILSARRRIAELAERDGLTGLVNQRFFREMLQREHTARSGRGVYAVLMVDMDRLKHINDTWGHEVGNEAIVHVSDSIRGAVRASDVACRYGGDEFAVFLPDATPQVAEVVAQRIRNAVFKALFHPGGRAQRLTVSVGVGGYPQDGRTVADTIAAADQRMYKDKKLRRQSADEEPPKLGRL
jgi:diguanylate cyclase (GGDEF)-like protein